MSTTYPRAPKRPETITAIEKNAEVEKKKNDDKEKERREEFVKAPYFLIDGYTVGDCMNIPQGAWGYIQMLREQLYDARKRIEQLERKRATENGEL